MVSPNNPKLQMEYYPKQAKLWWAITCWFLQTIQNFKWNIIPNKPNFDELYLDGFSKQSKTSNEILSQTSQIMMSYNLLVSSNNPKLQMKYYPKQAKLWWAISRWFLQTIQNLKWNIIPNKPNYDEL